MLSNKRVTKLYFYFIFPVFFSFAKIRFFLKLQFFYSVFFNLIIRTKKRAKTSVKKNYLKNRFPLWLQIILQNVKKKVVHSSFVLLTSLYLILYFKFFIVISLFKVAHLNTL